MEESEVKKENRKGQAGFQEERKIRSKQQSSNADEYFDGYYFCVVKDGLEM